MAGVARRLSRRRTAWAALAVREGASGALTQPAAAPLSQAAGLATVASGGGSTDGNGSRWPRRQATPTQHMAPPSRLAKLCSRFKVRGINGKPGSTACHQLRECCAPGPWLITILPPPPPTFPLLLLRPPSLFRSESKSTTPLRLSTSIAATCKRAAKRRWVHGCTPKLYSWAELGPAPCSCLGSPWPAGFLSPPQLSAAHRSLLLCSTGCCPCCSACTGG